MGGADKLPAVKGHIPARFAPELNKLSSLLPHQGQPAGPLRAFANWLYKASTSVRAVCVAMWQRHDLLSKHDHAVRLRKPTGNRRLSSMTRRVRLLER